MGLRVEDGLVMKPVAFEQVQIQKVNRLHADMPGEAKHARKQVGDGRLERKDVGLAGKDGKAVVDVATVDERMHTNQGGYLGFQVEDADGGQFDGGVGAHGQAKDLSVVVTIKMSVRVRQHKASQCQKQAGHVGLARAEARRLVQEPLESLKGELEGQAWVQ